MHVSHDIDKTIWVSHTLSYSIICISFLFYLYISFKFSFIFLFFTFSKNFSIRGIFSIIAKISDFLIDFLIKYTILYNIFNKYFENKQKTKPRKTYKGYETYNKYLQENYRQARLAELGIITNPVKIELNTNELEFIEGFDVKSVNLDSIKLEGLKVAKEQAKRNEEARKSK